MSGMSRDTRRLIVRYLAGRNMSPADIASELGVSRETVRRDLHTPAQPEAAPGPEPEAPPEPEPEAHSAAGLLLHETPQLRHDLNVITAAYKAEQPEDAARFAIHQAAQQVRALWQARAARAQRA